MTIEVVCMWCGRLKISTPSGDQWVVREPMRLPVSHGICPECLELHHPEDDGCAVCGDSREPDGWTCLGCGSV